MRSVISRRYSWAMAVAILLVACSTGDDDELDCTGQAPSLDCPRTLLGQLDTTITVGAGQPYGAAASSAGIGYVTLHGSTDALGRWDFVARTYLDGFVNVGDEPTNVVFSPNGARAYVASQLAGRVDVVTVDGGAVDSSALTPGNAPYQTAVLPNGSRFYASGNGDRIWIFNATSRALIDSIPVSDDPNGMAINPAGTRMFVSHLSSGVIGVINLQTGGYDTLAIVGSYPVQGIGVSENGSRVFVVSEETDSLYVFDAGTGANLGQAYTGNAPFGLALTPDGSEVWVTTLDGVLRRYSQAALVPAGTDTLGGTLRRIGIDPAGRGAIIADETGSIVIVK